MLMNFMGIITYNNYMGLIMILNFFLYVGELQMQTLSPNIGWKLGRKFYVVYSITNAARYPISSIHTDVLLRMPT